MPKYEIDIEGDIHQWGEATITVAQLRDLGGYPPGQEMIEVDLKDNTERALGEADLIELKPGMGFAKKVKFKRG